MWTHSASDWKPCRSWPLLAGHVCAPLISNSELMMYDWQADNSPQNPPLPQPNRHLEHHQGTRILMANARPCRLRRLPSDVMSPCRL